MQKFARKEHFVSSTHSHSASYIYEANITVINELARHYPDACNQASEFISKNDIGTA